MAGETLAGKPEAAGARSRLWLEAGWAHTLVLLLTGGCLLAWSWGKWIDPLIDFGRELYLAWRVSEGVVLYRDQSYLHGPFSPYFNGLIFKLFGVGFQTLVLANVVILGLLVFLVYRCVDRWVGAGRGPALVVAMVFLTCFAFSHLIPTGNYNFIGPYSHDVPHGFLAALITFGLLHRYLCTRRDSWLIAVGISLGWSFLIKEEFFLATLAGVTATFSVLEYRERGTAPGGEVVRRYVRLFGTALAPVAIVFFLFSFLMDGPVALRGVLGGWGNVMGSQVGENLFTRNLFGLTDLPGNLARMASWATAFLIATATVGFLDHRLGRFPLPGKHAALALLALGLPAVAVIGSGVWIEVPRAWPLLLLLLAAGAVRHALRAESGIGAAPRYLGLGLVVFGLALLIRMFFHVKTWHYGFGLAAPGTMVLSLVLVHYVPNWLKSHGGAGSFFRAAAFVGLAGFCFQHLRTSDQIYGLKTAPIGEGLDRFRAFPLEAHVFRTTLQMIDEAIAEDQTLLVLPEGVIFNYLSRRRNPTPYELFVPTSLDMFGEGKMLASMQAHPPDFVLVYQRDMSEYGPRFFGRDYGQSLLTWVESGYVKIARLGADPTESDEFGLVLFRRRPGIR